MSLTGAYEGGFIDGIGFSDQRCRSVFNIGGIIPHFNRLFGILKFCGGGGYSGFADFQVSIILKIWGIFKF